MPAVESHPPKRRGVETLALTGHLDKALSKVRNLTGVALAFGGPVDDDGVLLSRFDGSVVGPLQGVKLAGGLGLGGKVALAQRPFGVDDYIRSPRITHQYDQVIEAEGLRSMIAAPVVVGRTSVAVIYGAVRTSESVGARVVDTVMREVRALEQQLAVELALQAARDRAKDLVSQENLRLRLLLGEVCAQVRDLELSAPEEFRPEATKILRTLRGWHDDESAASPEPSPSLTSRELDILSLISTGARNADIAASLNLTTSTVKSYVKTIMGKLNASTRLEAAYSARRQGHIF